MPILNPWDVVLILVILVIIFGASRLSQVGSALGRSVREFRTAVDDKPPKLPSGEAAPAAVAVQPQVACPSCQSPNPASQKFCGKCGEVMAPPVAAVASPPVAAAVVVENTCPSCATVNPTGQVFCGQCGTRLTRAA